MAVIAVPIVPRPNNTAQTCHGGSCNRRFSDFAAWEDLRRRRRDEGDAVGVDCKADWDCDAVRFGTESLWTFFRFNGTPRSLLITNTSDFSRRDTIDIVTLCLSSRSFWSQGAGKRGRGEEGERGRGGVGGVHWRCVTKRSVSGFTPYFSSHAPYACLHLISLFDGEASRFDLFGIDFDDEVVPIVRSHGFLPNVSLINAMVRHIEGSEPTAFEGINARVDI